MKIIQDSWKIWFRKVMLKNHSNKFNRAKLGLSLIMAYIIQASWVKYGSYLIAALSVMECP